MASLSILIFIVGGQTFCVDDYLNDQNDPHTVMLNRHLGPTGHQRKYETHADRRKEINTCIAVFFACGRVKEQFCAQQRVGNEVQRWGAEEGETMVCSVVQTQEQRKAFF